MISQTKKENLKKKYDEYLNKYNSYEKYADEMLENKKSIIKAQEISTYVLLYSLVNLIYSVCCMTVFSDTSIITIFINTFIICIVFIFIPFGIHSVLTVVKDILMKKALDRFNDRRNELVKEYKNDLNVEYEKVIKAYNALLEYEDTNKKIVDEKKNSVMKILKNMNNSQFRKTIIWLLNKDGFTVYEHPNKELLCFIKRGKKGIAYLGYSNKKILLRDLKEFENLKYKDDYDYAKVFFINDISSVVYDYCVDSEIEMYDINMLCEEIVRFKSED